MRAARNSFFNIIKQKDPYPQDCSRLSKWFVTLIFKLIPLF